MICSASVLHKNCLLNNTKQRTENTHGEQANHETQEKATTHQKTNKKSADNKKITIDISTATENSGGITTSIKFRIVVGTSPTPHPIFSIIVFFFFF